jgi:hypothetical protein
MYPKTCNCCDEPVTLKNKQAYYYHKNNCKMATLKKAKITTMSAEEEWLLTKLGYLKKAVIKSHGGTELLETHIGLVEDDINEDDAELSTKVSDLCFQMLAAWDNKKVNSTTIGELKVQTIFSLILMILINYCN